MSGRPAQAAGARAWVKLMQINFSGKQAIDSQEQLAREEAQINRIAWFGGIAVTIVTSALLLLLLVTAQETWQYFVYILLGGIPFAYAAFSNFVIRRMQIGILHQYQARLIMRVSELEDMASRDGLTGLHNRRYFYEALHVETARAHETKEPLALIIMDLDGLKVINDEYGHAVGDVIIGNLAQVIGRHIRSTDTAARLGGDEFGVLMPGTDKRGAFSMARRLWDELEHTPMFEDGPTRIMVTISIGVAGFPWGGETVEEMVQWADADMYANKVSRRLPREAIGVDAGGLDSLPDDHIVGI